MERLAGGGSQGAREDMWASGRESAPILFCADEWQLAIQAEDRVVLWEVLAEPVVDRPVEAVPASVVWGTSAEEGVREVGGVLGWFLPRTEAGLAEGGFVRQRRRGKLEHHHGVEGLVPVARVEAEGGHFSDGVVVEVLCLLIVGVCDEPAAHAVERGSWFSEKDFLFSEEGLKEACCD